MVDILPERLEGPRLVLRRWTAADLPGLAAAVERNVEHLLPWMPWAADEPLAPARRLELVATWEREWAAGGDVVMAILHDDRVVGGAGLHRRLGPHGLEIGYWVDCDHLRLGYATEAAATLTKAALAQPGITVVEIHHDKANTRSGMVPRRLGYRLVGEEATAAVTPGECGVECVWRVTAGTWSPP